MPTYDYVCDACGHTFELFQSMTAKHEKTCPECRKRKLRRLIGMGAAILVGGSSRSSGSSGSDAEASDQQAANDSDSTAGGDSTATESTESTESKAESPSESKKSESAPEPPEKKISGSTSTPTHEAREGRGVGNLVDAARRQRRETGDGKSSKKTTPSKPTAKKPAGKTSKSKSTGGSAPRKTSKPASKSRKTK